MLKFGQKPHKKEPKRLVAPGQFFCGILYMLKNNLG